MIIYNQKFFDTMLMQNFFGVFERSPDSHRYEVFFRHHLFDGNIET